MAYSKARRLSDSISATGEVSAYADASIVPADLHSTLDLTGKTITVANTSTGDSDTTVANTAFVQQEIAALVASAPGTLNTLNELAAALGDDASFSTTVTDSIATKLPLAGGTLTGALIGTSATFSPSSGKTFVIASDSGDGTFIGSSGNQQLRIITNNATRITIAAAGDITVPGNLTVNAIVDADNFKINNAQGSDGQVMTSTGSGVAWENAAESATISSTAPSSPAQGDMWFNSSASTVSDIDTKSMAVYSGTAWVQMSNKGFSATGGTVTTSGNYKIHTFTSSGTFTADGTGVMEYLVIGGGGSGGVYSSGSGYASGNKGSSSQFGSITSLGGGAGTAYASSTANRDGGSGGGGGSSGSAGQDNMAAGSGTSGQGYNGGIGARNNGGYQGGGGGGASAVGNPPSGSVGGAGGAGLASSITGSSVTRAGGGGGGSYSGSNPGGGAGGAGGGGAGNTGSASGVAGTVNTGSGGGAGNTIGAGHGGGGAGGYRNSVSGENSGGGASAESTLANIGTNSYSITVGAGGASVGSGTISGAGGSGIVIIRYNTA